MHLQKIVRLFSQVHRLIIPYNPFGYNNPPIDDSSQSKIIEEFKFQETGFIYAFKNLISSLNQNDFYEFAKETCDPLLAEGFRIGMKKLNADDKNVQVVVNPKIKEEILFARPTILIEIDQDVSYYSQSAIRRLSIGDMDREIYSIIRPQLPLYSMTFGCYIKCSTSLKIQGFEFYPNTFHFVEFQMIKDPSTQKKIQWLRFLKSEVNYLFIDGDYQWRIINIDHFLNKVK